MTLAKPFSDLTDDRPMTSSPVRAVDGAMEFAETLEWLLEKLGSATVMLSLHLVAVHGLSDEGGEAVLRHAGGNRAELFELERNVHLVLFLGPDDRLLSGSSFPERLAEGLLHVPVDTEVVLRSLARWNHEITDPYYLLDQLLDVSPRYLEARPALVA